MAFVGIEFAAEDSTEEGGAVSLVHSSWLTPRKQEVWWPPVKHQDLFQKTLRKGTVPQNTWDIHKVKRCFFAEGKFLLDYIM